MAFAVIPNQAEISYLVAIRAIWATFHIHLFVNDLTPDPATLLADFTEASFPGYAVKTWTLPSPMTDVDGKAKFATELFEFFGPTSGGSVDVYGFYVTSPDDVYQLFCGRLATAPKTLADNTDSVKFDLTFKLFDAHQP